MVAWFTDIPVCPNLPGAFRRLSSLLGPQRDMSRSDDSYPDLALIPTVQPTVKRTPATVLLSFINEITDSGAVRDGFKLIVVGGILEASRRGLGILLRQAYYCELLSIQFDLAVSHVLASRRCDH